MPQVNPTCFHLSASSIASFKACPQRFRLNYREGLRPAADTDSQRMGTNWHAMHEVYAGALTAWETDESESENAERSDRNDYALNAVIAHLNSRYAACPNSKTLFEWNMERQILLTSFIGYCWYWQDDQVEVLASELPFNLPVHNPRLGLPLPMSEVQRVGKIDHVIRWQGVVGSLERKSTTRSIAPDSDYWDKAKKDTQVSMYALAFRDMLAGGLLPEVVRQAFHSGGEEGRPARFGNTIYDVWHKPTIKPAMLSQKDTAAFVASGDYCGQTFTVVVSQVNSPCETAPCNVMVDGELTEIEIGKKGFAIKETVGMFAARLLADIYERPDFYYARKEIARTDQDLQRFRLELYNIYQAQKMYSKSGFWFENESQCRATFPCPFIPICYGPGADAVCDGTTTPATFKRIFVDLTVKGQEIEE